MVEAERRSESFHGTESMSHPAGRAWRLRGPGDGARRLAGRAAAGWAGYGGRRSRPHDRILLGQGRPAGTLQMLGIGARSMATSVEATRADGAWTVHVDRTGTATDHAYHLAADGAPLRMDEQTWRGRREILPSGEDE